MNLMSNIYAKFVKLSSTTEGFFLVDNSKNPFSPFKLFLNKAKKAVEKEFGFEIRIDQIIFIAGGDLTKEEYLKQTDNNIKSIVVGRKTSKKK